MVNQDLDHQIKKNRLLENLNESQLANSINSDSRAFILLEQKNQNLEEDIRLVQEETAMLVKQSAELEG